MKSLTFNISSPVVIVPLMMLCFYAAFLDSHFDQRAAALKPYAGPIIHTPDDMTGPSMCMDWLCRLQEAKNADR